MTFPGNDSTSQSGPRRFFTKRMFLMLAAVGGMVLLIGAIFAVKMMMAMSQMKNRSNAVTVATTHAVATPWQAELKAISTLRATDGADLSSELAGIVAKVAFEPGQDIKQGTLLIQLRDESDRATLAAARASADQASRTYKRYAELIKTQAISQTAYDQALASMLSTKATADAQAATVEKKAIRAPFDGRVGIRQVDVGQYVGAGTTVVTLQRLDPIYADFQIAQQQLPNVHPGDKVLLTSDTFPGRTFAGKVVALDPKVDTATRTVRVRAEIANPGKLLLPGMFATVVIENGVPTHPLTLPQTAITYNTYGNIVFVVQPGQDKNGKDQLMVQQRFVTTGETRGDKIIILSGITAKDEVVVAGTNKLKNGSVIAVNNQVTLPNDANPHPKEQ